MEICGSSGFQRVLRSELGFPGRVGGGVTSVMAGGGEKLWPGENEVGVVLASSSEGVYRSKELTREKACGWGCGEVP